MALQLPIQTQDGENIAAYFVPAGIYIEPANNAARFLFLAYRSALARADGKAPLQFPPIEVNVTNGDFGATAMAPLNTLWEGGAIPADATIYDAIARLAYGLGKQHSEVLATAEDV
ncbi:hypothetical protein UFOVP349_57 [uncultured Caudovirales phage]|uniref:Uncharacterized protein n=1 Tax=uncultured Caudovirales phage TaxID=2100421 RepID=A0A6J5LZZ7_9CAUD|nr:hypothetical protein UFOVP349_57 [uncultured Caudovirales phage]